MSNFAALIDVLSLAGSRLSDGTANASGKVWFFQPGTNNPVNAYSDAAATTIITQPVTLTSGGLVNRADFPEGIYVTQPVRLYVEDVNANTVVDTTYIPATAGDVGINNVATTATTLDQWITDAQLSVGGTDFNYLESSGATARPVQDKFREIAVSVKDFGAVGDGIATDTTPIQTAMNRVKALGGGVCYFPPGTYLVDQALTLTSATGVTLLGVRGATTLRSSNATANVFTFATASTSCTVEGFIFIHTGTTTGAAISAAAGQEFAIRDVLTTDGDFAYGADISGASNWYVERSLLNGITRGLRSNISATNYPSIFLISQANSTGGAAVELDGAGGNYTFVGGQLSGAIGILGGGSFTGGPTNIFGCRNLATTAYSLGSTNVNFRWWGTTVDGYVTSQASGGGVGSSYTPNPYKGQEMHIRLTSGGAAILTINAPSFTPSAGADMRNVRISFRITAAAGGNITARFNAVYKIVGGGTDIIVTDTNTYVVDFQYDIQTSTWRECFRALSAT